ncbi:hypothetical protein [Pseudomonas rhizoryzae]|uniref:hypothetical protein n=1 Tax=Pseudomonas rhizoryzae TaxID=2571129 RepID=UPI000AC2E574|nr:hypothetical protein [Pseudomonas rhizoryzae]
MNLKDHAFSFTNQIWRLTSAPLTLVLLPFFLNAEIQGYWYVFIGVAGLISFADLGASSVAANLAAHEAAWISILEKSPPQGSTIHLIRLGSLFSFTCKWICTCGAIALPVIFSIGFYIFESKSEHLTWLAPWTLICISSALTLLNNFLLSFVEGCGNVSHGQKIRFISSSIGFSTLAILLLLELNLYALALSSIIGSLLCIAMTLSRYKIFFMTLQKFSQHEESAEKEARKEKSTLLFKSTAISFLGGNIGFQTITPIIFYFKDPVLAGQAGLSIAIFSALHSISCVWLNAFIPKFCKLIAQGRIKEANVGFTKFSLSTLSSFIIGSSLFFLCLHLTPFNVDLIKKIINDWNLYFLCISWLLQTLTWIIATHLRAQIKEPFSKISVITGAYLALLNATLINYVPFDIFFSILLSSYAFSLPCFYIIHRRESPIKITARNSLKAITH